MDIDYFEDINDKYESINSIVDSVDKKLYKANEKGRNKVVFLL